MAKQAAKVLDSLLPKDTEASKLPYYFIRLPTADHDEHELPYLIIPPCPRDSRLRKCISCKCYCTNLILIIALLLLIAMGLIFWHSQPQIRVGHVQFDHVNISRGDDTVSFHDTSMDIKFVIQSKALVPHGCSLVSILVGSEGKLLASTVTNLTFVDVRSVSYLDATVKFKGIESLQASREQLDGNMKGFVSLDILVEVKRILHFFSLSVPVQARVSCSVTLDTHNQKMVNQDCYPPPPDGYTVQTPVSHE